jgi:hypothetical protein
MEYKTALEAIARTQEEMAELQDFVLQMVIKAREEGSSWEKIGRALGMTKQGAMAAYSALVQLAEREKAGNS